MWIVPKTNRATCMNEDQELIFPNISKSHLSRIDPISRSFRLMDMIYTMTQELLIQLWILYGAA